MEDATMKKAYNKPHMDVITIATVNLLMVSGTLSNSPSDNITSPDNFGSREYNGLFWTIDED